MANPQFSLIIPTYNRLEALLHCFEHIKQLRFPKSDYEVIVVDDGSTDGTKELDSGWNYGFNLRVIHQENAGTAAIPRNVGIRAAKGNICLFVDDDVMVHPDLLLRHEKAHLAQPNRVVRGPVINFATLPCPLDDEDDEDVVGEVSFKHFSMNYLCTSNASLYRHHLLAAGLFDANFKRWEDAELAVRLKRLGLQRFFDMKAVVYHYKPVESLESILKTAQKDGEAAAALYLKYPSFMMFLRSGLHKANLWRNKIFTSPSSPLRSSIDRSARGDGFWPQSFATEMLREEAYLQAGLKQLELSISEK